MLNEWHFGIGSMFHENCDKPSSRASSILATVVRFRLATFLKSLRFDICCQCLSIRGFRQVIYIFSENETFFILGKESHYPRKMHLFARIKLNHSQNTLAIFQATVNALRRDVGSHTDCFSFFYFVVLIVIKAKEQHLC